MHLQVHLRRQPHSWAGRAFLFRIVGAVSWTLAATGSLKEEGAGFTESYLRGAEQSFQHFLELCGVEEWGPFREAWQIHRNWSHSAVARTSLRLRARLHGLPGGVRETFRPFSSFFLLNSMLPGDEMQGNVSWEERIWYVECIHGLLAVEVAVAFVPGTAAEIEYYSGGSEHTDLLPSPDEMRQELLLNLDEGPGQPLALGEHSEWACAAMDVLALLGPDLSWRLEPVPLQNAFSVFLARAREEEWIPPPLPFLPSAWSLGGRGLLQPSQPEAGQNRGLRVAIFLLHHGAFQHCHAVLAAASMELRNSPLIHAAYILQVRFPPGSTSSLLSFAGEAPPKVHANYEDLRNLHTLEKAEMWAQELFSGDSFLQTVDAAAGCSPFWVCVMLHRVAPQLPILVHLNMALLERFFFWSELKLFWSWVVGLLSSPMVWFCATHRLMAEQVFTQVGARPAYVPLVGLHIHAKHEPQGQPGASLLWKCGHPAMHFLKMLLLSTGATVQAQLFFHDELIEHMGPLPYEAIAQRFRAVVFFPHVPNPVSLGDLYSMSIPLFVPAEPYIYRFLWDFSNTFAGPDADALKRDRAPANLQHILSGLQEISPQHPYDPLQFLEEHRLIGRLHLRAYWYQYTEFAILPALQRFQSSADLVAQLEELSEPVALQICSEMRKAGELRRVQTVAWYVYALQAVLQNSA